MTLQISYYMGTEDHNMKMTRIIAWLLAVALLMTIGSAFGEELTAQPVDAAVPEAQVDIGVGDQLPEADPEGVPNEGASANTAPYALQCADDIDNDALFAGYVDMLFGKDDALNLLPNGYVGDRLKGRSKVFYDFLLPQVKAVAAGKRADTVFIIPNRMVPGFSWEKYWNNIIDVFNALLADCPYHLYWFDKVTGIAPMYDDEYGLVLPFAVALEYAKGDYKTNAKKIQTATTAVKNAKKVVRKYRNKSDYEKLLGYKNYICDAVEYNYAAIEDPDTPYGNPWQLIWAFDNDPSTNIVCEGYSKSFQYLCDLTDFKENIRAYSVTGDGGSGPDNSGGHMWNIVTTEDGKNYHVDITFCDSGLPGDFLVGADYSDDGKYYYTVDQQAYYVFNDNAFETFPKKTLKLSTKDYVPKPTAISIAQGDSATLYMGNKLALEAVLKPVGAQSKLTWKSNRVSVATVNKKGVVTPVKAGTAVVIVKTANGLSAKIAVRVVDVESVGIAEGEAATLPLGGALALHATIQPAEVRTGLTWTSSDLNVATVSADGVVQAVGAGAAAITVTTTNGKSAAIVITVA